MLFYSHARYRHPHRYNAGHRQGCWPDENWLQKGVRLDEDDDADEIHCEYIGSSKWLANVTHRNRGCKAFRT